MRSLVGAVRKAKRVYLCGNGGSAANAIHIANDLVNAGVRAHALTADVATLTAIANDYGYEHVFSRQLKVYGEPGDLLVCLSGSGNSPNVLEALRVAKEIGMATAAIVGGYNDSKAALLAEIPVLGGGDMQAAEDFQTMIGHEVMKCLKSQ